MGQLLLGLCNIVADFDYGFDYNKWGEAMVNEILDNIGLESSYSNLNLEYGLETKVDNNIPGTAIVHCEEGQHRVRIGKDNSWEDNQDISDCNNCYSNPLVLVVLQWFQVLYKMISSHHGDIRHPHLLIHPCLDICRCQDIVLVLVFLAYLFLPSPL